MKKFQNGTMFNTTTLKMSTNTTKNTIMIPYVEVYWGTGDDLRIARQTDSMFQLPTGMLAWSPKGLPHETYPHPRVNLIDRQKCHEAILKHLIIEYGSHENDQEVAAQVAEFLHRRLNEEIGVSEFVYLLMGSPNNSAWSSVFSSANEQKKKQEEMPKVDAAKMLDLAQKGRERDGKPLLLILPPPVEYYPDDGGPICAADESIVTIDEIAKALLKVAKSHKKNVVEFLNWISALSFDDMSALPFVPIVRETKTIPDHVLYMSNVVNKAMIWSSKTQKYYPA